MIHILVNYKVKKDKVNIVKKAIKEFIDTVKKNEPGTHYYGAYQLDDKVSFLHFMTFEDEKAKRIHETSSYVKKFVEVLYTNCTKKPVFTDLSLIKSNRH